MFRNLPDPTPLIYWGLCGIVGTAIVGAAFTIWVAYHVVMALTAYIGG